MVSEAWETPASGMHLTCTMCLALVCVDLFLCCFAFFVVVVVDLLLFFCREACACSCMLAEGDSACSRGLYYGR